MLNMDGNMRNEVCSFKSTQSKSFEFSCHELDLVTELSLRFILIRQENKQQNNLLWLIGLQLNEGATTAGLQQ